MGRIARVSRVNCDKRGDSSADANVLRDGGQFVNTALKVKVVRLQRDRRFQASPSVTGLFSPASPEITKTICTTASDRQGQFASGYH